jgi:hypothetical protein
MQVSAFRAGLTIAVMCPALAWSQCNVPDSADYQVDFTATWSAETLPHQFPANAHFSGLVGGSHNAQVSFWEEGELASTGIEEMAETGSKTTLIMEINDAIGSDTALDVVSGGVIAASPGFASTDFTLDQAHSLATVVSMIAPSPDWFVGVNGLNLFSGGNWLADVTVDLFGYDAGTDSGVTYTSANSDTQPPQAISALTGEMFMQQGELVRFGTFRFLRLTESCLDSDGDGDPDVSDPDDDGDGMPDVYEMENGLDPLNKLDAFADADGDGHRNRKEFRAGTDPNDPDSPSPDLSWLHFLLVEGNFAPVADAGADQNVTAGTVVILDGSGSSDADGDSLSYSWTFVSTPSGSSALFDNADVINPKFTADLAGSYVIGLVVSDGTVESSRDTVRIQVTQPKVTLYKKSSSLLNPTFDAVSLPYSSSSSTVANVTGIPTPTTYTLDTFRLTAEGQTFTIINVLATEVTGQLIPFFDSLSNGFLLADGEELNFELVSPLTGGVQVQLQFRFEILESGETFLATYMFTSN